LFSEDSLLLNHGLPRLLDGIRQGTILGWVYNRSDPDSSLVVQIVINGTVAGFSLADQYREDLRPPELETATMLFSF
jgi:hypothetical protein